MLTGLYKPLFSFEGIEYSLVHVGGDIARERGAKPVQNVGMGAIALEEIKDDAVSPVGDFIALVGGFAAVIFAIAVKWYSPAAAVAGRAKALKGVNPSNPVGVICFAVGAGVFAFAVVVLVGRFVNPNFRLVRSPGWVYAFGASIIFMACIVGLAVPPNIAGLQATISAGVILELFAGAAIGVGGLLKF
jgi:hypothetical protein